MHRFRLLSFVLLVCLCAVVSADDWQLVYEDDFERDEPGPAWHMLANDEDSKLHIVDGELVGDGGGLIMFNQPVYGDQKVICTGRWIEGTGRSMSQFAGLLKGSTHYGFQSGVALVHGRSSNRFNTVEFLGYSGRLARNTGPLPEPGKQYTFEYAIEGKHVYMKRDGEMIIEADLPFELDGPSANRIFFYANEMRIRFDSIKIYNKGSLKPIIQANYPLPMVKDKQGQNTFAGSDPEGAIAAVLKTARTGDGEAALKQANAITDPQQQLDALMMLVSMVTFEPSLKLAATIRDHVKAHPELEPENPKGALTLKDISQKFATAMHSRSSQSAGMTLYLLERLDDRHPMVDQLLFHHGRSMMLGEGGLRATKYQEAERALLELFLRRPDLELVRMLLGEKVPWGEEFISTARNVPPWAKSIRETHSRLLHVLNWWATVKQAPDGQLGGGWGDDVETLRAWGPVLTICDANKPIRYAMRRLVDGAWQKAEGGLELGYSKKLWDVEHSAEPSADTQPLMLLFADGEDELQKYTDRNMLLLPLTRDKWTTVAPNGQTYYKNVRMSALEVDDAPESRAHTPYHTRALKGLSWLAWRHDNAEVEDIWLRIVESWREAILREEAGKIAGAVPVAVDPKTGKLGSGTGDWYYPALNWSYYDWSVFNHVKAYDLLCAGFLETGDEKYLQPIFKGLEQAHAYEAVPGYTPEEPARGDVPSPERQRYELRKWRDEGLFVPYLLAYQIHTGKDTYADELQDVLKSETLDPVRRYQIDGDPTRLMKAFEASLDQTLRYNFPMMTSQMQRTDDLKRLPHTGDLYVMMGGALKDWGDAFRPTHCVSFKHSSTAFAALTRRVAKKQVNIRFVNFDSADSMYGFTYYELLSGKYTLTVKTADGKQLVNKQVEIASREHTVQLNLPIEVELFIELKGTN